MVHIQNNIFGISSIAPQRKVPALLTPQGETLTESAAILLTLDDRHPEAALLPPPGTADRAQALRWLLFISSEVSSQELSPDLLPTLL